MAYSVIEMNVSIICTCMPTLKPLLRNTWTGLGFSKKSASNSYNYGSQSKPKISNPMKKNGDTLMDASYIELGKPGTHRDVHIAAHDATRKEPWLDQSNGGIVKTDTFGQDVYYKEREDSA